MAEAEAAKEVDLAIEDAAPEKKSSPMMKYILFSVLGLALIGAGAGVAMFLLGGDEPAAEAAAPAEGAEEEAAEGVGEVQATEGDKAIYYSFDPAFVVNFQDDEGVVRYLQVGVDVMTYNQPVVDDVKNHMPLIRNNLVMLFSSQTYGTLMSREGKENLRKEALAEIRSVLDEQTGDPGVEAVYFTSFVIQ